MIGSTLLSRWCVATIAAGLLTALSPPAHAAPVEANSASSAELESVKGIGPRMAGHILNERRSGNFRDWGDLIDRVQGIGPASASKFSNHGLTVNGAHYSATDAPSSARGQHRSSSGSGRGVIMTIPQPAATPPQAAAPPARPPAERKPAPRPSAITQAH